MKKNTHRYTQTMTKNNIESSKVCQAIINCLLVKKVNICQL